MSTSPTSAGEPSDETHWDTAKRVGAIMPTGDGVVFTNLAWKAFVAARAALTPSQPEPIGMSGYASRADWKAAQPEPPAAGVEAVFELGHGWLRDPTGLPRGTKLYATPPALTDAQCDAIYETIDDRVRHHNVEEWRALIRAAAAGAKP